MNTYTPNPVDLSEIELSEELNDLREAIAESVHEAWAANRQKEERIYGLQQNDETKQTPDMTPYANLPESEKLYVRKNAVQPWKLIKKISYDLVKVQNSHYPT